MEDIIVIAKHGDKYIDKCLKGIKVPYVVIDTGTQHPTGAYLTAYRQVKAKNYLFMQDSMESLIDDPVEPFRGQTTAWASFPFFYDDIPQREWVRKKFTKEPELGIFGPVFYVSRENLEKLDKLNLLPDIPENKWQACGTERAWACAFFEAGIPVRFLGEYNREKMGEGLFPFKKVFANRS